MPAGASIYIAGGVIALAVVGLVALAIWSRDNNLPPEADFPTGKSSSASAFEADASASEADASASSMSGRPSSLPRHKITKQRPLIRKGAMQGHFADRNVRVDQVRTLHYKREPPAVNNREL